MTDTIVGFLTVPLLLIVGLLVFRWVTIALSTPTSLSFRTLLLRTTWPLGAALVAVLALGLPLVERPADPAGTDAAQCNRALRDASRGGPACAAAVQRRRELLVIVTAFGVGASALLLLRDARRLKGEHSRSLMRL